eukprot:CAMPEP_0204245514 /NCGR_PEP_ID=MMETSP0361-20130328/97669_1 /ASSEMBLY_ACC=CAM_ASM_000343 /TAXON_ID=268821 /ORGANISM="Scrippsiella Hangoei, Strain SHTV-5" /LENGTH=481 /DNA_ID=CAMNT_0051218719 /DNA_START=82 /DNA_END=1527 /DNA_ORIENTATION=-
MAPKTLLLSAVAVCSYLVITGASSDDHRSVEEALIESDECAGGGSDEQCALAAVQLRGQRMQGGLEQGQDREHGGGAHPTHADADLVSGNYNLSRRSVPAPAPALAATAAAPSQWSSWLGRPPVHAPAPEHGDGKYRLDWEAKGTNFFEGFDFLTTDGNHGASDFVGSYEDAKKAGVAVATGSHAILRAGPRSSHHFKRLTGKIATKKTWKHFLAAVRFTHVPYGCGVWPAFFTLGAGVEWPSGGEMDILEYVNDQGSMTSFHTTKQCKLDPAQVNKYGSMPDANLVANNNNNYNCLTKYCATCTSLGCAPNKMPLLTGQQWASRPGVFAMQRTDSFAKLFFIPDADLPGDLSADEPTPEAWDRWIISYYPFGDSAATCPQPDDIMAPQMFILQVAFCGDWASKVWGDSPTCSRTGPTFNARATKHNLQPGQCRAVDPLAEYAPQQDCCTQFITDADGQYQTDDYLHERAFFNISWFKVFT